MPISNQESITSPNSSDGSSETKPDSEPLTFAQKSENTPPPTRSEEFAKTASAAKLSGSFNEAAGYFKRKLGELTHDSALSDSGRDQQLLGKIHRLVGTLRSFRESTARELKAKRVAGKAICRKHGGRALDVASDFVEEIQKTIFK